MNDRTIIWCNIVGLLGALVVVICSFIAIWLGQHWIINPLIMQCFGWIMIIFHVYMILATRRKIAQEIKSKENSNGT